MITNSICYPCNDPEKPIKAKGLCNPCYTAEHRQKAKKKPQKSHKEEKDSRFTELESKLKETQEALGRQRMENSLLRRKEMSTLKEGNLIDNGSLHMTAAATAAVVNLSEGFVQENLMKTFHYDERKYKEYLEEVKRGSKKWNSLGEEQLTKIFPCFPILLEQHKEKNYSKRSKGEREQIKEGLVEGRCMVEAKGRMLTYQLDNSICYIAEDYCAL